MTGWCGTTMTTNWDDESGDAEAWKGEVYPTSWADYETWPEFLAGPEYRFWKKELDDDAA